MTQDDLEPRQEKLVDPKKNIRSGFKWMGIASALAQGLDAISLFIVMLFISKEDMGQATLAVSYAACVEAFCACGVGKALVQDDKLSVDELHSLFWFATASGVAISLLLALLALPAAILIFHSDALLPLMLVGVTKLIFVSTANVPIQLINRRLEYNKISIIQTVATLGSSLLKIGFAALGFGAWSLVLANTSYGFFQIASAFALAHYIPKFHFKWTECRRFVHFGIKFCVSSLGEVLNKNLHYFIVGKFFGEGVLGLYRVGYELAMTPALALLNVVNQSSYPVFSRVKDNRQKLSELFSWNQSNIAIFSAVPIVFICVCASDIFSIIKDGKWMAATDFIVFALGVAFLKSLMQTFSELYKACGYPEYSIKASVFEAALIFVFFVAVLSLCPLFGLSNMASLNVMFCTWMLLFIPLFMYHHRLARQFININFRSTLQSVNKALLFLFVAAGLSFAPWYYEKSLPFLPWSHFAIEVVIVLVCLGVYVKLRRKRIL